MDTIPPPDKMMFNPSTKAGSTLESLEATTVYWKNVGKGRLDRMAEKNTKANAERIAYVLNGEMYAFFETCLYEANIDPDDFPKIRVPVFREVASIGKFDLGTLSEVIANVLAQKFESSSFALIVYNLQRVYQACQDTPTKIDTGADLFFDRADVPKLIEGILQTYISQL